MKRYLIFTDLDGTLLDHEKTIPLELIRKRYLQLSIIKMKLFLILVKHLANVKNYLKN